ncbi:nucleotide sugar dehydrogenase [Levilinea saccharolytica]|uniref:Nucleotide sugar dehydrogenase n=1 Tax=Levilinea saccharolytica TaxID=229921 RepID=A0A0M8JQA7_9CHLR|nr:nucleotide sugar dehydrogenase [Levilinea saccharolytica]KPL80789.1 UDP-N-acetyl-D-glucosamine dehydrogenase [Levilinea saccharolytica]GAP19617.1 nucleotide sugar dehydrogenase [Levilinea saccharolytica]
MSNSVQSQLVQQLENKTATVAILGLGYVGLPLAAVMAEAGYHVIGIDPVAEKVDMIQRGESYVMDVPTEQVARYVREGRLEATTDFAALSRAQAVSICVPTPLRKTGDPDLSFIVSATEALFPYMHRGMVVVLESSTYPGTTREMVLSRLEASGLKAGEDFFLAFSPERVDPGRTDWTTYNTPKVVGGITEACCDVSVAWYRQALETVVRVSSTEVAEMAKLLENTFRMINIAMVNELAIMCDRLGVDVWEVIDAAATKPFGFMKFTPGPGLGGHCIPIDPLYLSWKLKSLKYTARFIELASEINTGMPRFAVTKVQDALNEHSKALKGSAVLVLGVAYKPDIDDLRESPALDVIGLLEQKGAHVKYHDPFIPHFDHEGLAMTAVSDLMTEVRAADCVVIITNHKAYDYDAILENAKLIVDTRNALGERGRTHPKVVRL